MMKTVGKWCVLLLLMAYAVGMAVWANAEASRHVCTGIEIHIEGDARADSITRSGVAFELGRYPRKIVGERLSTINTLEIEKYLGGFSNFESVECLLSSQGKLQVNITPMIPEIRVFDADGRSYYVNKDGKEIVSNAEFFADVPIVQGRFSKTLRPKDVLPVTRFVSRDSLLSQLVASVVVRDRDNILLVPRVGGHVINIGDASRLAEKRNALLTAYRNILPYRGWDTYDTISVKFRNLIVATRRDKSPLHPLPEVTEDIDPEEATLPEALYPAPSADSNKESKPTE